MRENGRVNISDAPLRMRPILKTAAKLAKIDFALQDAYADYPQRHQYLRELLEDAALEHNDTVVAERIREDGVYFSIFKSLV